MSSSALPSLISITPPPPSVEAAASVSERPLIVSSDAQATLLLSAFAESLGEAILE